MNVFKTTTKLAAALILMLAAVAANASEEKPSGTLTFEEEQIMAIIGGSSGSGTLEFNGTETLFKVSGVSVGASVGVHKLHVSGDVYHLTDVADFSGTYVEFEAGEIGRARAQGLPRRGAGRRGRQRPSPCEKSSPLRSSRRTT